MNVTRKGMLIVVSGPSGVGKGTVVHAFLERYQTARLSVSVTTRARREGEIEGVNYFFRTVPEFEEMIERGEFLEYMRVYGMNYYGTLRSHVFESMENGHDVVLEIDVNGAMRIKEVCPEAVLIFIAPPSMSDLKTRLYGRGTETDDVIERRYREAYVEMGYLRNYDYVVVNDVIDKAVDTMCHILDAERCRIARNEDLLNSIDEEIKKHD